MELRPDATQEAGQLTVGTDVEARSRCRDERCVPLAASAAVKGGDVDVDTLGES